METTTFLGFMQPARQRWRKNKLGFKFGDEALRARTWDRALGNRA